MEKSTKDNLPVLKREASKVEKQITDLVVKDDESLAEASDRIRKVKDLMNRVETERELFTKPAKEIIRAAKAKYDPLVDALKGFEKVLKEKAQKFLIARQAKQKEDEAKIAARVEKGTLKPETAIRKIEELPQDQHKVRTEKSMLRLQYRKDIEIFNPLAIPKKYFVIDRVKLRADMLAGVQVDGARIIEVPVTQSL